MNRIHQIPVDPSSFQQKINSYENLNPSGLLETNRLAKSIKEIFQKFSSKEVNSSKEIAQSVKSFKKETSIQPSEEHVDKVDESIQLLKLGKTIEKIQAFANKSWFNRLMSSCLGVNRKLGVIFEKYELQVSQLEPTQIPHIDVKTIPARMISKFSTEQIQNLTEEQIKNISSEQLQQFTDEQLNALMTKHDVRLFIKELKNCKPDWILKFFTQHSEKIKGSLPFKDIFLLIKWEENAQIKKDFVAFLKKNHHLCEIIGQLHILEGKANLSRHNLLTEVYPKDKLIERLEGIRGTTVLDSKDSSKKVYANIESVFNQGGVKTFDLNRNYGFSDQFMEDCYRSNYEITIPKEGEPSEETLKFPINYLKKDSKKKESEQPLIVFQQSLKEMVGEISSEDWPYLLFGMTALLNQVLYFDMAEHSKNLFQLPSALYGEITDRTVPMVYKLQFKNGKIVFDIPRQSKFSEILTQKSLSVKQRGDLNLEISPEDLIKIVKAVQKEEELPDVQSVKQTLTFEPVFE